MKKYILLLVIQLVLGKVAMAQVTTQEQAGINEMVSRYHGMSAANKTFSGWRVQIIASTDRVLATAKKTDFLKKFPNETALFEYTNPYYKVKVGAFITRGQAEQFKTRIIADFPDAYLTKDEIKILEVEEFD